MEKRLYRSRTNKSLGGVCGGLGNYFNVDPVIIRVAYVLLAIFSAGFPGLLVYIILCIVIPNEPEIIEPWQDPTPPQELI